VSNLENNPVIDEFLSRNDDFAGRHDVAPLRMMPSRRAIIIGCVDPRVDPAAILGVRLGEAIVIRNIGGRVTPAVFRTLRLLSLIAGSEGIRPGDQWNLVVLQHTNCGISHLTEHLDVLASELGTSADALDLQTLTDPRASLAADLHLLRVNEQLPRGLVVSGLLYNTDSGHVETVVAPAMLGAA
jgi:carbonic anhydrase